MQRLIAFVLIHHDNRGTRVHFRRPLPDAPSCYTDPEVPVAFRAVSERLMG
jgi:hypothetical protein